MVELQVDRLYRALSLLEQMKAAGIKPDSITFNTLLQLCDRAGQGYCALALYEVRRPPPAPLTPSLTVWYAAIKPSAIKPSTDSYLLADGAALMQSSAVRSGTKHALK